jgi:hypothetical protein
MKVFLCLMLVIVSFISYPLLSPRLSFYQYHPIMHYLGMSAGIVMLLFLTAKKFSWPRLTATIFSVGVVFITIWFTLSFSQYSGTQATIAAGDTVGARLKQVTLVSPGGNAIVLGDLLKNNRAVLVVLNRGEW